MADAAEDPSGAIAPLEADPEFVRRVLDTDPTLVFVKDRLGRFVYANRAVAALFGLAAHELIGQGDAALHPEAVRGDTDVDQAVLRSGRPMTVEETFTRSTGEVVDIETTRVPLELRGKRYVLGVGVDVTARRRAEAHLADRARWYRALVRQAADIVVVIDEDGVITYASPAAERVLGYPDGSRVGTNVLDLLHPEDLAVAAEALAGTTAQPGPAIPIELRVRDREGTWRWFEIVATNLLGEPAVRGVVLNAREVTERVDALRELRRAEARFRALVAGIPDLLFRMTTDGVFLDYVPSESIPTAVPPERFLGRNVCEVLPSIADPLLEALRRAAETGAAQALAYQLPEMGWHRHYEARISPLASGEAMVLVRDVSEQVAATQALQFQALHDPLTGLANRSLFLDVLASALARARRGGTHVALLFIDLDRFKVINDSLGHEAGDQLLVEVAGRLRAAVRQGDTVGRFGGDEFAVICEGVADLAGARAVAHRVADAIAEAVELEGIDVVVTASIGIVLAEDPASPSDLLRDADAAMYQAKERGRSRVEVFDASLRALAVAKLADERDLRRALTDGQLVAYFQPQVDLGTGQVVAVEALLRWQHPTRGLLGPDEFLAVAEESGLIGSIGREVLRQACHEAARLAEQAGPPVPVWVNLSARELHDAELVGSIRVACEEAGVEPARIGLEMTETALLTDLTAVQRNLLAVRKLGIRVAIDDFGSGYSSLALLRRLPLDVLKVDRTFVDGLPGEDDDTAIVTAIVGLSRALGLITVAEGVEHEDQAAALRQLGCGQAQGFLFGPPVPADELHRHLDAAAAPDPV